VEGGRSGWNSEETILTPANVKSRFFAPIGSVKLPDNTPCTTQILYWEGLNLNGSKNVIFCWTNADQNNANASVYAIDADSLTVIWGKYIGQQALWATHAPAIDDTAKILYFIYKNNDDNGFNYLIGIDIMTGKQVPDSPKLINGTVPGTGDASVNGVVMFQNTGAPRIHQNSRTSILIENGLIIFGFAHNSDSFPYHGWVFAYRYTTGKFDQTGIFCTSPNAGLAGIWQGGQGISSDGTYIYFTTGNGDFNAAKNDFGMAIMKLDLNLKLVDYFVPAVWSRGDGDLGCCGTAIIPNSNFLVAGLTKYGGMYLVDKTNLGKWNGKNDTCRQYLQPVTGAAPGGNPVVWNTGTMSKIYVWSPGVSLLEYHYNPSTQFIDTPEISWTTDKVGGGLFITSNGPNDAILWAYGKSGHLYAFDASAPVSNGPIWQGNVTPCSSWGWPTITNGKAYIPASNGQIYVFGLKTTEE